MITHIELHPSDAEILNGFQGNMPAEYKLLFPPLAIYVALDKVDIEFIPPTVCPGHQVTGFDGVCPECQSHPGLVQVCPQKKKWHYTDTESGYATSVERTQLPIMPEKACPLYGLQGTTTDPGLIGHFAMPRRLDTDIKWLIVYVMLSRVRSLDRLASLASTTRSARSWSPDHRRRSWATSTNCSLRKQSEQELLPDKRAVLLGGHQRTPLRDVANSSKEHRDSMSAGSELRDTTASQMWVYNGVPPPIAVALTISVHSDDM